MPTTVLATVVKAAGRARRKAAVLKDAARSPTKGNTSKGGTLAGTPAGGSAQELILKKMGKAAWQRKGVVVEETL